MSNRYNIYQLKSLCLNDLYKKLNEVKLIEQKSKVVNGYTLTFYFSEKEKDKGNDVWWYKTYRDFFNDDAEEPFNFFYFGLLVAQKVDKPKTVYLISLGKSHFYLNKFIEKGFGINIALRIANEKTMALKKSRIFGSIKRKEITSYLNFEVGNYMPGESVEYLKMKAEDQELWGEKNIIFGDSIQIDSKDGPIDIVPIFEEIEMQLSKEPLIELPKMEQVLDAELIKTFDCKLLEQVTTSNSDVKIEEFTLYGIYFSFNDLNYDYSIYYKDKQTNRIKNKKPLGNEITLTDIKKYINSCEDRIKIDDIKLQFSLDGKGKYAKALKELLDCHYDYQGSSYFLRAGEWYLFNHKFMEYLKKSLDSIDCEITDELFSQSDYIEWKERKKADIAQEKEVDNKITYPEWYFNTKKASESGYELMDRNNALISSLKEGRLKYKLEVADLYKDKTFWAVKIGCDKNDIIYNIEQSKDSLELRTKGVITNDKEVDTIGLWFVYPKDFDELIDINSIQVLLAIEAWKKKVEYLKFKPKIRITKYSEENK